MKLKRNLLVFLLLGLLFFTVGSVSGVGKGKIHTAFSCAQELKNPAEDIHLVVENCSNVGTFSLGGLYHGNWEKLTFFYPLPWEGTFITLQLDDELYVNSFIPEGQHLDNYLLGAPTVSGNEITVAWLLPGEIILEEIFSLAANGTFITFRITNQGTAERKIGLRLHLDTMIGDNDGAPIYLPGKGLLTAERAYRNINFDYWKAYNRQEVPTIVSTGSFSLTGITLPDKVVIANWRQSTHSSWDYDTGEVSILGDSAVLLYFDGEFLAPGDQRKITTYYGRGTTILPGKDDFGLGEIISTRREGYCPPESAEILVDVVNKGLTKDGHQLELVVRNSSSGRVFSRKMEVGALPVDAVKSLNFSFLLPRSGYPLDVEVVLTAGQGAVVARKIKSNFIHLRPGCRISSGDSGLNWFFLTILFFLLAMVIIAVLSSSKSEIVFRKIIHGATIKVVVWNKTSAELNGVLIEDHLPAEESEIDLSTSGVTRSHDQLVWRIDSLGSGERAILEYRITGKVSDVPAARLVWDSQEKMSQNVIKNREKTKGF